MKLIRIQVLDQARKDVSDRQRKYGDPRDNYRRFAELQSTYDSLRTEVSETPRPVDLVVTQLLSNIARLIENPDHQPTWENIAGYGAIGAEVARG